MGKSGFLMDVQTLSERLSDPCLRVVDCRFSLFQPQEGLTDYLHAHVPGAVYANLDEDLAAPIGANTGRHPLPEVALFARRLGDWGINNDTEVLVYDQQNGAIAARLWWMLRWLGNKKVSLLDGGFSAWTDAGYPLGKGNTSHPASEFVPRADAAMVVSTQELYACSQRGDMPLLVDAREAIRFAGVTEPIDSVAGHIPGAVNFPVASSLDSNGRWLPREVLRQLWQPLLSSDPETRWVVMCGSGCTACHLAFSAEYAGFATPELYVDSWSGWIRDPARPVARSVE